MKEQHRIYLENEQLENIRNLSKLIVSRLKADSDIVIAITGETGVGKSSLAIWMAMFISEFAKVEFDLINNVAYIPNHQEIIKQFNSLSKYSTFVVDEAVRGFHKHQWSNKFQQLLTQMFNTERYQNKATILVIPRFKDLAEYFRNERVKIWVHVIKRGYSVVYTRDDDEHIGMEDPWHIKGNIKIKQGVYKSEILRPFNDRVKASQMAQGYLMEFIFPKLPEDLEDEYKQIKIDSRKKLFTNQDGSQEEEGPETITGLHRKRYNYLISAVAKLKEMGLTQADIGRVINCNKENVRKWLGDAMIRKQPHSSINNSNTTQPHENEQKKDYLNILHKDQVIEEGSEEISDLKDGE